MNNIATPTNTGASAAGVLSRLYDALATGDLSAAVPLLAPDVVLHVPGRHHLAGDYRGAAGIARFTAASRAVTGGSERVEVVDVLAGRGPFSAAYCRVTGTRADGARLENSTIHVARLEDGRIAEIWFHNFDQHAVDRFWGAGA